MTNKEMKKLIQKQSKQISELISLVQELEKKDKPFPTYAPWKITYPSDTTAPDFKNWPPQTWMKNEPMCVMDSCLGNEITAKEAQAAEGLSTIYSNAAIF